MAIKRCPYCKSFIEEKDKYCKNCGTQLLFPEDEAIEEDIPGDKIIDDEQEDEELSKEEEVLDEIEYVSEPSEDVEDESKLKEDGKEYFSAPSQGAKEILEVEEEEDEEIVLGPEKEVSEEEVEKIRMEADVKEEEEKTRVLGKTEGEEETILDEEKPRVFMPEGRVKKTRAKPESPEPPLFKTQDLEEITRSVDKAKREVEEFLMTFQEKKAKKREPEGIATPPSEEIPSPTKVLEAKEVETQDELPPWVGKIKETPPSEVLEMEAGETARTLETGEVQPRLETTAEGDKWSADSGIGIPEGVTQKALPFEERRESTIKTDGPGESFYQKDVAEEEEPPQEERSEPRPPRSTALSARAFDISAIVCLWLVSLWLAAEMLGVSLLGLIAGSFTQVFLFFLIMLLAYFFLFLFFLGETLGDRLFPPEEG